MPVSGLRLALGSRLFWFGLAFAGFGLLDLGIALKTGLRESHFERDSRFAQATIVAKDIKRASQQENSGTEYRLRYRFTPPGGTTAEGTVVVPVEQWESAQPGAALALRYLPEDPTQNRLAGRGSWFDTIMWSLFGIVFGSIGVILLWRRVGRIRLTVRLMRNGIAAEGTVVRVVPTGFSVNRVTQWRIQYQYTDASGHRRDGASDLMPPGQARRWKAGERVAVRFDPAAPGKSIWIDDKLVR